jgi:hypothetical protein
MTCKPQLYRVTLLSSASRNVYNGYNHHFQILGAETRYLRLCCILELTL